MLEIVTQCPCPVFKIWMNSPGWMAKVIVRPQPTDSKPGTGHSFFSQFWAATVIESVSQAVGLRICLSWHLSAYFGVPQHCLVCSCWYLWPVSSACHLFKTSFFASLLIAASLVAFFVLFLWTISSKSGIEFLFYNDLSERIGKTQNTILI